MIDPRARWRVVIPRMLIGGTLVLLSLPLLLPLIVGMVVTRAIVGVSALTRRTRSVIDHSAWIPGWAMRRTMMPGSAQRRAGRTRQERG